MKKWLKRISARIAQTVIEHFEPKIDAMDNEQLKLVLKYSLKWVHKVLHVLTDADPNDQQQLEAVAKELIENGPAEGLQVAKVILLSSIRDEEAKKLVVGILDDLLDEIAA